jgi:hypothetical protein
MKVINDEVNFNKNNLVNIQWNSWKLLKNYWKKIHHRDQHGDK